MLQYVTKYPKSKVSFKELFSIVIPTWNNLEYIKLCVNSIRKNSTFNHQIIVLVNEGIDRTLDWLKNQNDIDYVHSRKNIGICHGLNICRSLISTQYIVYANDDMYFLPNWDKELKSEIDKIGHNRFIISSTMIEPFDTGNSCVIVKDFGEDIKSFKEKKLLDEYSNLLKDDWYGSTWPPNIMHIDMWDLVGGMSVEFSPGMYSDPDLSMKLWQAGVRYFKGSGKSKVYHFGSKSTKRVKQNKGKDTFLLKWGITARFFTDKFLKRGQQFQGELPDYKLTKMDKLINWVKKKVI